jgi:hypothetical protein
VNAPETPVDRPPAARRAWAVFLAALYAWLARTPAPALREQLKSLQFWSLEIGFVLVLALGFAVARRLASALTRRDAVRMALLAASALVLTLFVAPRTNRIYYDEQIYQGIGQNLADLRLAQMCNAGSVEYGRLECLEGEYNKQPYAYPHLLSVAYRLFGVHPSTAFAVNAVVMALAVPAVYLLVLLLFDERDPRRLPTAGLQHAGGRVRDAAFFAGLLLLLTPEQIVWSATAASEPAAAFACLLAVLSAAWFFRSGDTVALAATGAVSAWAVQFRPECLLVLPVVALVAGGRRGEWRRQRLWWVMLLAAALLAVHAAHLFAVRHEGWGTADERLSLKYLPANLRVNLRFYLGDWRFPVAFTGLAAAGALGRWPRHARLAAGAWFVAFFGMFLLFYAGSYNYGADIRYSLMTYAPLATLGGAGAAGLAGWARRRLPAGFRPEAALTAAVVFVFLLYAPLVRATTEEAWAARADVRFAQSLVPRLQGNAYVLTHNPGMFHVWGVNAGQMSRIVVDPGYLGALAARYAGGVYLHWNFWCNVQDPVQQEFCQKALVAGRFTLVREYRERDQRFALYRLAAPPRAR